MPEHGAGPFQCVGREALGQVHLAEPPVESARGDELIHRGREPVAGRAAADLGVEVEVGMRGVRRLGHRAQRAEAVEESQTEEPQLGEGPASAQRGKDLPGDPSGRRAALPAHERTLVEAVEEVAADHAVLQRDDAATVVLCGRIPVEAERAIARHRNVTDDERCAQQHGRGEDAGDVGQVCGHRRSELEERPVSHVNLRHRMPAGYRRCDERSGNHIGGIPMTSDRRPGERSQSIVRRRRRRRVGRQNRVAACSARGERTPLLSVTCPKSGEPRSLSMSAAIPPNGEMYGLST